MDKMEEDGERLENIVGVKLCLLSWILKLFYSYKNLIYILKKWLFANTPN